MRELKKTNQTAKKANRFQESQLRNVRSNASFSNLTSARHTVTDPEKKKKGMRKTYLLILLTLRRNDVESNPSTPTIGLSRFLA